MFRVYDSEFDLPLPHEAAEPPSPLDAEVTGLFRQFRNPLLRYLLAVGLPEHDGEEVIQEVFLALFEHLRGGKSRRNLRGWLFRVAHNLGLKRRMSVRQERLSMTDSQQCDPALNPEEQLASAQHQQRLRSVFDALPEADQRCLVLRAEGLRYREIAGVLNLSLGSVSLSINRSIARLERSTRRSS